MTRSAITVRWQWVREPDVLVAFAALLGVVAGLVRMVFEGSTTEVYLSAAKKGKAIITANAAYKTAGGVGPCSTFASLKAAIPAVARAGGADKRLWKSGRLWFRVENNAGTADLTTATVRAVMLVATPPPAMKKAFIGNTGLNCGAPAGP